jgi:ribosome-associated translation inhibitor RaiA
MDMHIVVRGVDGPAGLRELAEEKLSRAIERFQERILTATMRLEDVTGPEKGGIDKVCNVEVRLRTGEVRIKEQGEEFEATINVAMDRRKTALVREAGKAKNGIGGG